MTRKYLLFSCFATLALACFGCGLQDVPNGQICRGNTEGRYANDAYSEFVTTDKATQAIKETGYCIENYSFCIDDVVCSSCPSDTFYVKRDDKKTEYACLTCAEIEECTSSSCVDARINCTKCVEKCQNGILAICDEGVRRLMECKDGCNDAGTDCSYKTTCGLGQILSNGECVCNVKKHWVNLNDKCVCEDGLVEKYGDCVPEDQCHPDREIWDEESKTCVCNTEAHWAGDLSQCGCAQGYVLQQSQCVEEDRCSFDKEILDLESGECICNANDNWTGTAGQCKCKTYFDEIDGVCEFKNPCNRISEDFDFSQEKCVCNATGHWIESEDGCRCQSGYVLSNGKCVLDNRCNWNEKFDEVKNECVCNNDTHWTGEHGSCQCAPGYVKVNDECQKDISCNSYEKYNEQLDICECNGDANWVGDPGNCACKDGYVRDGNVCVRDKACGMREVFSEIEDKCVCDESKFWTGTAGKCTCKTGYADNGGVCRISCKPISETPNAAGDKCECNRDLNWVGVTGACKCAFGYKEVGGQCMFYSPGESFEFGSYYQSNFEQKENIRWRVLTVDVSNHKYFVISEKGLDDYKYYTGTYYDEIQITWSSSSIRTWLNSTFMDDAFDETQKKKIIRTHVHTPDNSYHHTTGGPDTDDYLFLLSLEEVRQYLPMDENRVAYPTAYAEARGARAIIDGVMMTCNGGCPGWWMLRTPGYLLNLVSFVYGNGSLCGHEEGSNGETVNSVSAMVRPAMWIAF